MNVVRILHLAELVAARVTNWTVVGQLLPVSTYTGKYFSFSYAYFWNIIDQFVVVTYYAGQSNLHFQLMDICKSSLLMEFSQCTSPINVQFCLLKRYQEICSTNHFNVQISIPSLTKGGSLEVGPSTFNLAVVLETAPAFCAGMSKSQKSKRIAQMSCKYENFHCILSDFSELKMDFPFVP